MSSQIVEVKTVLQLKLAYLMNSIKGSDKVDVLRIK